MITDLERAADQAVMFGEIGRIAMIAHLFGAIPSGGTDFRARLETGSMPYQDRILGADMTDMDAELEAGKIWSGLAVKKWWSGRASYIEKDLQIVKPRFAKWLESIHQSVPFEFADALVQAYGSSNKLPAQWVGPKGLRPADTVDPSSSGMHLFGTWTGASTYASVNGALPSTAKGAVVMIVSMEETPGDTSTVLTATLQNGTTTKDIAFVPSAVQYGQKLLGQQAIGVGGAAAGATVIPVAATAQFTAGEWILLESADGLVQETVQIAPTTGVTLNTSLTITSPLINTFAENDLVLPKFVNTARKSGTLTGGKHLDIYGRPDRVIAL